MEPIRRQNSDNVQRYGSDVDDNDLDDIGDGDQSPMLPEEEQERYHRAWPNEEINHSPFARFCMTGEVAKVRQMLKDADTDPERPSARLIRLLETRETFMRFSPILMLVSLVRHFEYVNIPKTACQLMVLIKYGGKFSILLI